MQDYFETVFTKLELLLEPGEVLISWFQGEDSDFVRFNRNRVRQSGSVIQRTISVDLVKGQRHARSSCSLSGAEEVDHARLKALLITLREQRVQVGDDPYLLYAKEPLNTVSAHEHTLPDSAEISTQIISSADGLDLVGHLAAGAIYTGFANSLGQRNWHSTASFNFDWSCFHEGDKGVKYAYSGIEWSIKRVARKMNEVRQQLALVRAPVRTIRPGRYRVYLSPQALEEILRLLTWGGFSIKSHRTSQSPLVKMTRDGKRLHASIHLCENQTDGLTPNFTANGFIKPDKVELIRGGEYGDFLIGPRSAREYGEGVNADGETPQSLDMAAGVVPRDDVLQHLDRGLYISNLWYCNYSDRHYCRITGMTRFACFWVDNGEIVGPVNVMRFDESAYRLLGNRLAGLTREREFIADRNTYAQRSTASVRLPGALVDDFTLTL